MVALAALLVSGAIARLCVGENSTCTHVHFMLVLDHIARAPPARMQEGNCIMLPMQSLDMITRHHPNCCYWVQNGIGTLNLATWNSNLLHPSSESFRRRGQGGFSCVCKI